MVGSAPRPTVSDSIDAPEAVRGTSRSLTVARCSRSQPSRRPGRPSTAARSPPTGWRASCSPIRTASCRPPGRGRTGSVSWPGPRRCVRRYGAKLRCQVAVPSCGAELRCRARCRWPSRGFSAGGYLSESEALPRPSSDLGEQIRFRRSRHPSEGLDLVAVRPRTLCPGVRLGLDGGAQGRGQFDR